MSLIRSVEGQNKQRLHSRRGTVFYFKIRDPVASYFSTKNWVLIPPSTFSLQFNAVSYRVISTVVRGLPVDAKPAARAKIIAKWIDIAQVDSLNLFSGPWVTMNEVKIDYVVVLACY